MDCARNLRPPAVHVYKFVWYEYHCAQAVPALCEYQLRAVIGGWQMNDLGKVRLNEYNSLYDPNMRHFFENKKVQGHLYSTGQIDRHGRVIDLDKNKSKLHVLEREFERAELIETLMNQKRFCFDTETTSLDPRTATPLGIAFSFKKHHAYYVVIPESEEMSEAVLEEFRAVFENESIVKIGMFLFHFLKFQQGLSGL